jgi:uncharacterized RDD family membrane protein YckC
VRSTYQLDTPENVRFSFERAGLGSRALAWVIDVAVMLALIQIGALVLMPFQIVLGNLAGAVMFVIAFLVQWWYAALCEWRFHGRTVGKRVAGIATMDDRGLRLSLYQAVIRNLLRVVDFMPGLYLVGGVASLWDPHGRRLGDLAAGTVVVRERRGQLPRRTLAEAQRDVHRYPAFIEAARRLSPAERDAVLALCLDRERLPLGLRVELFERLSSHLETRLGLGRPAHLSAEKVILYVGAALANAVEARPRTREQNNVRRA